VENTSWYLLDKKENRDYQLVIGQKLQNAFKLNPKLVHRMFNSTCCEEFNEENFIVCIFHTRKNILVFLTHTTT
jgi:hypothetical protein